MPLDDEVPRIMPSSIMRGVLRGLVAWLLISVAMFALVRSLPEKTILRQLDHLAALSTEDREWARHALGLERPFWSQYGTWISGVIRGDLGQALTSRQPVLQALGTRVGLTGHLLLLALLIAVCLALPAGMLAAVRHTTVAQGLGRLLTLLVCACPNFWVATVLVTARAVLGHALPPLGFTPLWGDPWRCLTQLWLPALILGAQAAVLLTWVVRHTLLVALREHATDAETAQNWRARVRLVCRHLPALRLPMLTWLSQHAPGLVGGAVLIEVIFVLPGVGSLLLDAVLLRDYPMVQGVVMFCATAMVGMHLLLEVSGAWLARRHRTRVESYDETPLETVSLAMLPQPRWSRWGSLGPCSLLGMLGALLLLGLLVTAVLAPHVAPYHPSHRHSNIHGVPLPQHAPHATFVLGTDTQGRDVLSGLIYGARSSLLVGGGAVILGMGLSMVVGVAMGSWQGRLAGEIQRLLDVLMTVPGMVVALAVLSVLEPSLLTLILVLGLVMTPSAARVVRDTVLAARHQDAGQAAGASPGSLSRRHLFSRVATVLLMLACVWLAQAMVMEAALDMLGVGLPPPTPTWGGMLRGEGYRSLAAAPYLALFPGLALSVTVLACQLCGDAVQAHLPPGLRIR